MILVRLYQLTQGNMLLNFDDMCDVASWHRNTEGLIKSHCTETYYKYVIHKGKIVRCIPNIWNDSRIQKLVQERELTPYSISATEINKSAYGLDPQYADTICQLTEQIDKRDATISSMTAQHQAAIREWTNQSKHTDAWIRDLNAQHDTTICNLTAQIGKLNAHISTLNGQIDEQDAHISTLNGQIDATICELTTVDYVLL